MIPYPHVVISQLLSIQQQFIVNMSVKIQKVLQKYHKSSPYD